MIDNAVCIGKNAAPKLLWTNPNPNDSFSGQTITFGSEYSGYIVELKQSTSVSNVGRIYVPVGKANKHLFATTSYDSNQGYRYLNSATANSISFGEAKNDNLGRFVVNNSMAIPTRVYGVNWSI